jgi:hypothetical protein
MPRTPTLLEAGDGHIRAVNRARLFQLPYFLMPNAPNNSVAMTANQSSLQSVATISGGGPGEIVALSHEKTAPCLAMIQIQDGETIRALMNGAIHVDAIFGDRFTPYRMPESLYIDELRSIAFTFTDISGSNNAIRPNTECKRYLQLHVDEHMEKIRSRMEKNQYLSYPYWYTLDRADNTGGGGITIPAGTTIRETITIGQQSHFEWSKLSGVATSILFDINIVDVSRGESVFDAPTSTNRPVSAGLVMGNGNFPMNLHQPRLFQIGQRLEVTLVDRSGADNTVHLALGGKNCKDMRWR